MYLEYFFLQDEKYLVLKKQSSEHSPVTSQEPSLSNSSSLSSLSSGVPRSTSVDSLSSIHSCTKQPPPYRSPPPVQFSKVGRSTTYMSPSSSESSVDKTPPPVPPRRRSSDKMKFSNKENEIDYNMRSSTVSLSTSDDNEVKLLI